MVVGSLFAVTVAAFIMIACAATLHQQGIRIETAKDAALALGPLAGQYAEVLFALGLLNASLFSACILPLSTAYLVCEAFGWESSLSREVGEAKVFFTIYTGMIILGALIILLPIQSPNQNDDRQPDPKRHPSASYPDRYAAAGKRQAIDGQVHQRKNLQYHCLGYDYYPDLAGLCAGIGNLFPWLTGMKMLA